MTAASKSTPTPTALDRAVGSDQRNAFFAGSDSGTEHWAVIASLVETAKLNGAEPRAHLADVIVRIVSGHPSSRIDELLPWAYPTQALSGTWPEDDAYGEHAELLKEVREIEAHRRAGEPIGVAAPTIVSGRGRARPVCKNEC